MGKKIEQVEVPEVVMEAQSVAEHLDKDLMDRIVATPWFFGGTTFETLKSGVIKVVYFYQRSDVDHWYRGYLMWRDADTKRWTVDHLGEYTSLAKARTAIDGVLGADSDEEAA